jgi:hypothetical protein
MIIFQYRAKQTFAPFSDCDTAEQFLILTAIAFTTGTIDLSGVGAACSTKLLKD